MWKANLLRSVFAGIGALKHGDMAVVWTMRVMRSELWVCELCIFPLLPTRNHRVHSNFWKVWRFISVVSPSPCDSPVEDSDIFGSTWRCNKALFQASEWYWYIGKSWECTKVAAIVNCTGLYGCMVERGMHCKLFLNSHLFDMFRPGLLALWMTCIEFCLSAHLILLCVDLGNLI